MDLGNPVMAVAMLTQQIARLEESAEASKAELSECLRRRGALLMAMGDKRGAEGDMQRYLQLNPGEIEKLSGEFRAEGREHCG